MRISTLLPFFFFFIHTLNGLPSPELGRLMLRIEDLPIYLGGGSGDRYSLFWWKDEPLLLLPRSTLVKVEGYPDNPTLRAITVGRSDTFPVRLSLAGESLFVRKERLLSAPWIPDASEFYFTSESIESWEALHSQFMLPLSDNSDKLSMILPRDNVFKDRGTIYANPGESVNLMYFDTESVRWEPLDGFPFSMNRGLGTEFLVADGVVLWGGEGNIFDFTEVWRGVLGDDSISWASEPEILLSTTNGDFEIEGGSSGPQLHEITRNPSTGTFFLGLELGIMRGNNRATEFAYVPNTFFDASAFCFPTHNRNFVLAGGNGPALAWSADDGLTWTNISELVYPYAKADSGEVVFIVEDPHNRVIVGILDYFDPQSQTLNIVEINLPSDAKAIDAAASLHSDGWAHSTRLGWLWIGSYPWVWSASHQSWLWTANSLQEGLWIWDTKIGWLWAVDAIYPWLWAGTDKEWLWFGGIGESGRWFWSVNENDWLLIE